MSDPGTGTASVLRAASPEIGAGVYAVDGDGRVTAINPAACDLLGYEADEVIGVGAHDLWHFLDATGRRRPAAVCPLTAVAWSGTAETSDGDVFVHRDGTLMPVAWTSVPVVHDGRLDGAVVVFHPTSGRRGALRATGDLPEVRAGDPGAAGEAARTAFLTDATLALISTLDVDEALAGLARILVPRFADWCVIDLLDVAEPEVVRRVTVAHRNPARVRELGHGATVRFPLPPPPGPPLARVLRGATSVALVDLADGLPLDTEMERQQNDLFDRLGAAEALIVGLQARTRTIGAVTLVRTTGRHFSVTERALAEDIALRAGIAVDNARLYTDTRSTAEALQRSLLPHLPTVEGVALASTYVPAGRGAEVGGDWYDAFPVATGLGVALGDVVGHDLQAASRMGDIRTLLRGAALVATDPAAAVTQLDAAMQTFVPGATATACYGVVTRHDGGATLWWSNAGHPPPLLVAPGQAAEFLDRPADPLLGAMPGLRRTSHRIDLPPGALVVFYSDGLVEDRDDGLEAGMGRLREVAGGLAHEGAEALNARLLPELGHEAADDVAVLVVGILER